MKWVIVLLGLLVAAIVLSGCVQSNKEGITPIEYNNLINAFAQNKLDSCKNKCQLEFDRTTFNNYRICVESTFFDMNKYIELNCGGKWQPTSQSPDFPILEACLAKCEEDFYYTFESLKTTYG